MKKLNDLKPYDYVASAHGADSKIYTVEEFYDALKENRNQFDQVFLCKAVGIPIDKEKLRKLIGRFVYDTGINIGETGKLRFLKIKGGNDSDYVDESVVETLAEDLKFYTNGMCIEITDEEINYSVDWNFNFSSDVALKKMKQGKVVCRYNSRNRKIEEYAYGNVTLFGSSAEGVILGRVPGEPWKILCVESLFAKYYEMYMFNESTITKEKEE